MPRKRKVPAKLQEGVSEGYQHDTPKELYRQIFYQLIDHAIESIYTRFDQPGFATYTELQEIVIKATAGEPYLHLLEVELMTAYSDDVDFQLLQTELSMLKSLVNVKVATISDVVRWRFANSNIQPLLPQMKKLLRLILVLPTTNAVSERFFPL